MDSLVVDLRDIGPTPAAVVGGKGAHLGELSRIVGIRVPAGFCVTTDAFRRIVAGAPAIDVPLDELSRLQPEDRGAIATISAGIRRTLEAVALPEDLAAAITRSVVRLGEDAGYAVRSSATAEDLPTSSFAGQYDTSLNVVGTVAILREVRRCWASLFTERAVTYRLRNGMDQRSVAMAVVVQRMVFPGASGVLFTADPVTSDRRTVSVEATFGLGEALVSGRVNPDVFTVRDGRIVTRAIGTKQVAVHAVPGGGTRESAVEPDRQGRPALSDDQVVRLAQLGRRIEAHLGCPQDIEWCLVGDGFEIVQSRPITTLFPLPETADRDNHVYVSVGHQQMMTDAMRPLGLSVWQLTTPRPMAEAGGRLFVDVTRALGSPSSRAAVLGALGRSDPLIGDALETILERGDFVPTIPDGEPGVAPVGTPGGAPAGEVPVPLETDPAIVAGLMADTQASLAALRRDIVTRSGPALIDFIRADLHELQRLLFDPRSHQVFLSAMEATWWLNEQLEAWLGERSAADTLSQSVPDNVTSAMGLALLDVADVIRPHPEVVAFLDHVGGDEEFLDRMDGLAGGPETRDAVRAFLDTYGMRGVGEIDITRPRWAERPATLLPVILGHVRGFGPGAAERRFEQGLLEARRKEQEVLERLRALPDGAAKADETKRKIDRVRTFIGYREYPKYGMVSRYFLYKRALLEEAGRLVAAHVLREPEDIFSLTFDELDEVVRTHRVDEQLVDRRRDEFTSYQALTPPRVFTSDGEVVTGTYRRGDVPTGALVGLPVSAGVVEGRARVVADVGGADLGAGDILVTAYTDPSWSPVFVGIAGLVTEVGGLMTHGAVIAREYGLPAVVGVESATRLIRDGQRIRVHGTDGYVEILSGEPAGGVEGPSGD